MEISTWLSSFLLCSWFVSYSDQTVPCCDSTCLLPRDKLRLFWQINVLALHILCLLFYSEIFVIFVYLFIYHQFSSVQSLSRVQLFATPWIAALQASLSITNSWSSPKLICIESVMPSSHLILCRPLLLPQIPPSIRVFSNESTLRIRWPKYWSFSFSISPSNEYSGLISFRIDWFDLLAVQWESSPTPQFKSINDSAIPSSQHLQISLTSHSAIAYTTKN